MKKKGLIKFKNREEFAKFWDNNSLADHLDQTEEVDEIFTLAPELAKRIRERSKKKMVALRLEEWQINRARSLSKKLHQPYQSIIRRWVGQGILAESRAQL